MKSLEQLYETIRDNEELKKEFATAVKESRVEDFLKKHDCDATAEDVMSFMNTVREGAVSDDDLDMVAGGTCTSATCQVGCGQSPL